MNRVKENRFMYDENFDRLLISRKGDSEVVKGSVRFHNLVFDFSPDGRLLNVEITKVSELLEMVEIDSSFLKTLKRADFKIKQTREGYLLYFIFENKFSKQIVPFNFQTNKPLTISS
jgi:hypothetical protein